MQWLVYHSSMMLMKGDTERETLYSQYPQVPVFQTLYCIYMWFLSEQRYGNETAFSRKVHYSGLNRVSFTLRFVWKCSFKPDDQDLLFFVPFFSFCQLRLSVPLTTHTQAYVWALTNTIYHDCAQHSKSNINQRSNTSAFSSQAE